MRLLLRTQLARPPQFYVVLKVMANTDQVGYVRTLTENPDKNHENFLNVRFLFNSVYVSKC